MNSRLSAGIGIAPDSGAATDLNRLHQLKVGKNRDSEANVHKVAQEFESLFLNEMMKAMRSANAVFAEGNFMNSNESKTYQDMHDQQLAITMSKQNGVGLADVLERQLSKTLHGAGSSRPNPFAQVAASSGVTSCCGGPPASIGSLASNWSSMALSWDSLRAAVRSATGWPWNIA